jgi:hypothetical protein
MLESKTHFEQVSIEVVRKMVEEQIRQETQLEPVAETGNKGSKKMLLARKDPPCQRPAHFLERS